MKEERRSSTDRLYGSFDGNVFGSFSSLGDDVGDSEFQFVFRSTLISSLFTDMTQLPDDMFSNPQNTQPFGSLDVIMPWYCCDYCEILT
ncbi:hypothetical protein Hanom_Chr15g01405921 [Helianthus anomalus]